MPGLTPTPYPLRGCPLEELEGEGVRVVGPPRGTNEDVERSLVHDGDPEADLTHQLDHELPALVVHRERSGPGSDSPKGSSFIATALFTCGKEYLEIYDEEHSEDEDRFVAIGPSTRGIMLSSTRSDRKT
jgi:hypothetical protein